MRVLVTGANGFVGRKLVRELLDRNHEVFAGVTSFDNDNDTIKTGYLDILDENSIIHAVRDFKPQGVIHLAAQTMVSKAWDNPKGTMEINVHGTINMLQAIKQYVPEAKVLTIGSSEEYGLSGKQGVSLTEETPCFPQNPYAVSKFTAGQIALQISLKENINLVHVRPFNHFGPGQKKGFVISDFISQLVLMDQGRIEPIIHVGDVNVKRDFTYIDDITRAYILLLERNVGTGIYNVCSGIPRKIEDILFYLMKLIKIPITIMKDEKKMRVNNTPLFIGSAQKINTTLGWSPQKDFYVGLEETFEWWRQKHIIEGEQ
ncbi:GDP-mannose 4,6-dehydratase [Paenibacillus sp. MSJ-34]|uniref:GDP-mannose 4,6-dehydratase n=1 Tax=Paenibacillus sp. MSJ-34 TaxID=2841529 RepID=UPI001C117481|nr:GDP-mannose 4,6-dehydratase [Paenibacillus sp. MSJ-34]MBU5444371.1 GDP-mannose 4,6-dehydratase [Paenibacillus sp. MSJ-34]